MPAIDMTLSGIASTMSHDLKSEPLAPPRMPAVRDDWGSASEEEKELDRQRTRSKDRERKMRRRTGSDAGTERGAASGPEAPTRAQTNSPASRAVYEEDGIRIAPIRPKQRSSGSRRRKKEKPAYETDDGGVRLTLEREPPPPRAPDLKPIRIERSTTPDTATEVRTPRSDWFPENPRDSDDGIRVKPIKSVSKKRSKTKSAQTTSGGFEIEIEFPRAEPARPTKPMDSGRVRVSAWDDTDGIRIYTSSPIKSTDRKRSVRHSAKTVRSRREQYEASNREGGDSHMVSLTETHQGEEGDDEGDAGSIATVTMTKGSTRDGSTRDIEGSTVVEEGEPAQKRWEPLDDNFRSATADSAATTKYEDYDDGIRIRPIKKSRSTRRKRSPEGSTRPRDLLSSGIDDSFASETVMEPQSTLSESTFAPSNGTGRRNTVPSSPYTVRERANSYQSGEPDVALKRKKSKRVERVPSQKKSLERVASKMRSEGPVRDTSPFSEMSERRPRTKYSPSRDRDERRAERREMRRQLREDSEKFQDMATRARSASPATRRPITPPPTTREYPTLRDLIAAEARKESEEQERRYNESEAQERRYSESLPPVEIPLVRERPAVREKTVVSEPPISKIIPLVRGDSVVKERRRTREVHTSKAIPLVREDSVARDKPRARDSPVHRSIPLVREDSVREKPRARASPVSRTIPLVREDSVRDKPRGREPPSSKPIQLVRDDSVRDKPRGREAPVAKSTPMARERTVVRERLGLRDENSSKPIPLVREDSIAKEMPASKAIPLVRERSVARDKPAVQDRSVVRDKSAVRERPLARDSPVPPQAPDIRSGRARRKSISGAVSSSVDDLRLKWERPGLSSPRPSFFSSSDSLPLDKGKPSRASKTTPALARTRSRSTPPAPRPSRVEHTSGRKLHHPEFPSAPAQKKEAVLVPKLSSLLKAVKEEFKGKSVRTATMLMDDNSESSLTETNSETETDDSEDESEEEVAVVKKKKKTVRIQEAVEDITTDTSESVSTTSESSSDSSSYSESGSDGVVGQVEVEGTSDSESGSDSGSESDSTAEIHEELVALVEQVPAKPLVQNDVQPLDWPAPEPPKSPVAETLKTPAVEPLKTTPTKPLEEPAVKILSETLAPAASKTPPVEEPAMETTKPAVTSPVVEEPVVEEPVVEKPVVEVPIAEAPVVEEPIVEEPAVEEPVVQAAKILVVEVTKSPAVETVETVVERPTKTSIEQAPDVQPLKPSSSIRQLSKASIFANKLPSVEANPPKAASSTTSASAPAIPGRPVKPSKAKRRAERLAEALLTKESVEPAVGSPVAKQPTEPVPESPVSNKSAVESPTDDEPVKLLVETQTPAGTVNQPVGIPTSNETVENIVETLKEPVEDIKKPEPEPVETPNAITKPEEPVEKAAEIPNIEIPVDVLQPIKKPKGTAKPRAKTLVEKALEALQAGSSAKQTLEVSEVDNQSVEPPKVDDLAPKSKEVSTIEELVAKPPQTPPSEVPDAKPLDTAAVKKVNRPITMSGFMTSTFKESIIQKPAEESLKSTMQPIFKISDEKTPKTPTTLTSEDPIEQRVVSPHQKAMGTVEEPPKRSVRDLVKQLEKPSGKKTKTGLSEEILKDLLREGEKSKERSIDETEINSVEAAVADMVNESSGSIQKAVNGSSETVKEPAEITVEPLKLSCKKVIVEVTEPIKPLSPKKATAEPVKPISLKNDVKAETKSSTMQNIPELSIPRRTLRSTTSPPRPRSTVSDGSLTPTGSVFDDGFDDDDSPVRNLSDASTIKPLRFTKISKPQVIELVKPSRSKIKAEKGPEADEIEDWFNPDSLEKVSSLKRKYTKHTDLISILSVPNSSSVRSAHRSRRSKGRKRVEILTIEDILGEFATEEVKYLRELRTLVEDVVPILFQTVLGRADDDLRRTSSVSSIGTCSSRSSRTGFSSNPTRPIVDMGISLERLRTLHDRIPTDNVDRIIAWAGDARRVYEEYLTVWRMGFQEVVVTMTPLPGEEEYDQASRDANIRKDLELLHGTKGGVGTAFEGDPSTWAMPPPPSIEEDPKDEKVDVAFLLKRPLVRLKLLAKLFKVSLHIVVFFLREGCRMR